MLCHYWTSTGVHEAKHEAFGLHLWYRVDAVASSSDSGDSRRTQNTAANTMNSTFDANMLTSRTRSGKNSKTQRQQAAQDNAGSEPFQWFKQQHAYATQVVNLAHQLRHHPALAGLIELVEEEVQADHHGSSTSKGSGSNAGNGNGSGRSSGNKNGSSKTPSPTPESSFVPSSSASVLNATTSITTSTTSSSSLESSPSNLVAYAPNDPRFVDQGHYGAIHVPQAWTLTAGVPSVVVRAVICVP